MHADKLNWNKWKITKLFAGKCVNLHEKDLLEKAIKVTMKRKEARMDAIWL